MEFQKCHFFACHTLLVPGVALGRRALRAGVEDLPHGQHVGAAADPIAGQRGEPTPDQRALDAVTPDQPEQQHRQRPAAHDGRRRGEKHADRKGAELHHAGKVDGEGQQHQAGRQHEVLRDVGDLLQRC